MPAPSKAGGVTSISENGGNFQHNTLGLGEEEAVRSTEVEMFSHETFRKEMDGAKRDTMALVMVDKSELLLENVEKVEETDDRFAEEQKDGLSALIKDWSTSSKTFCRRSSCEFTTCVAPCVKKATSHLQQLQGQLMKWSLSQEQVQELSKGSDSRNASAISDRPVSSQSPYSDVRMLVSEGSVEFLSLKSSPVSHERSFISGTQELSSSRQSPSQASRPITTTCEQKSAVHSMGYNVVDEVLRLLGRLERDRLATQQTLVQETKRVSLLKNEIDRLAFKRLTQLPTAVQKEHESCTTDINELKWHCSYQGRVETRIKRRVSHAETMNSKFIEDVDSSKRSCPLVKEKLELESQAMASIQAKQDETDDELRQTLRRLEATEMKTAEAKERGTQERMLIKQDVDIIRNLLNEVSDELAQLKMNYTSNVHTISDIKNTLKENAQQCHNLEKREEKVKSQELAKQEKVVMLKEKITEQASEHVRLLTENEKLRQDNLNTEGNYQKSIANLKMEIKQFELQVREFSRRNKAMREDMDSTVKHTEKCQKQKISDKKALVRAGQEVENVKLQNEMMAEEIKKVKVLNQSLKTTKTQRDEEYFVEEEGLRSAESSLRSQLKEESHTRTVLQARIAADTSDLLKSRVESKKKKAKVTEQAAEVQKVVARIEEQVSKLDKVHTEREKTISQMNEILEKLSKQREEMESKYKARIAELRPKEELAKKENVELEKQIDQMKWKSDMMEKKMEDMSTSSEMMSRVIYSTEEDISELEEDNKEAKLRLQASVETDASLKEALEDSKERSLAREEEHTTHLENRRAVLDETTILLQEKLGENKALAEKYQKLHSTFLQTKEAFFKHYESLVNEESNLKDHKEIFTLQGRMRQCLQHYYRLRGLHNKWQVAQFQLNSNENNDKLFELKQNLTNVITHINNFLESNNAAHKTISVEAANAAQRPAVR